VGGAGHDTLIAGTGDDVLKAGSGNDYVDAGFGNDSIDGGAGADILVGGDGNDILIGGSGRDLLIGGFGADNVIGNSADDILIGGYTSHDNNLQALLQILEVWSSNASYVERIQILQAATSRNQLIADLTVHDDDAVDSLTGAAGSDWFFANVDTGAPDNVTDLDDDELATEVNW
jgi:Ca2+-binding RTX toxin-like protein